MPQSNFVPFLNRPVAHPHQPDDTTVGIVPGVENQGAQGFPLPGFGQDLDRYSGCSSTADESGPEVVYRLDIATPTRLRMTVHDRGATDIDLHLLDETASEAGCLARNHQIIEATLNPGTYHVVLDTFVDDGVPLSGEFIFSVLACPADDPSCG